MEIMLNEIKMRGYPILSMLAIAGIWRAIPESVKR